ncbi:MAG: DedA family protein [Actinomycetota bacterium]
MLEFLQNFVTDYVTQYGYVAIFVLMLLESACVPIPSEVTMVFGGALVSAPFLAPDQQLDFVAVALVGSFANLAGSWLAYWVGYVGGRPMVHKFGRYVLLRPHEIDRAHDWFERHGQGAVFFSRLLPVVRTFVSLPAGVARMPFVKFSVYTLLGCLPWCFALTFAGYKLGEHWETVERIIRPFSLVIGVVLVVGIAWWVRRRLRDLRGSNLDSSDRDRVNK